ncbi:2,4-dichlorophenol 6-monooxygenase [Mycobacteroides salmoniphilum]|uniref:2,4-dichlorophenol 6-monooxygenase n=1 Tax=Mycobacteroides salmoniphilum TaxID=404941 RepID=A0A4R8RVV3_9MYCO|nr:NAD(P)/FAD-dependent oxidoreductase [Mycobacteroides salmoniphilum]TDZ78335.1 2,4-dichlorophenol 6-monooxygenase [Mycobacteroides salmoniphilum]
MDRFDVIVVGARCAGAPLATMLATQGVRVCVLDKAAFPSEVASTNIFQPNGLDVLRRLGLMDEVMAAGAHPVEKIIVRGTNAALTYCPDPAVSGQIMNIRRITLDAILVRAAARAGADVRTSSPVDGILTEGGRVVGVQTRSGPLYADLVVGADGRHSTVAKAVGAQEYLTVPGGRLPTWAYYEGANPSADLFGGIVGNTAFLGGVSENDSFLLSVCVPTDQAGGFLTDRYVNFDAELPKFPELADAVRGARRAGPLRVLQNWHSYFRTSAGAGWALVGDAGHFKDFTPGQGMSDAFRQAEHLAGRIVAGLDSGGLDSQLRQWWRWRDADALQMYWLASLIGEGYLPTAVIDAALERAADHGYIERMLRVLSREVKPGAALYPWQLPGMGWAVARGLLTQPSQIPLAAKIMFTQARWIGKLAANHPRLPTGARRHRMLPAVARYALTADASSSAAHVDTEITA